MEADRALLLQVKKQVYNKKYAQKKKLQQQQSQDMAPKKLGRPPSIQVSKTMLMDFTPKSRGRPAQSVQPQQVPQVVVAVSGLKTVKAVN